MFAILTLHVYILWYIVDDCIEYDFDGLCVDWFRLHVLTSVYKTPLKQVHLL